jgi:hypothetical protein
MADLNIIDAIKIIRKLLTGAIQADRDTRAAIEGMTDDEVIAYARNIIQETDEAAGSFIAELEGEVQ